VTRHVFPSVRPWSIVLALLLAGALASCSTTNSLRLREYSKNIVIDATGLIYIQKTRTSAKTVVADLRARGISDTAYIVLHVHRDAPARPFELVSAKLANEGYEHVTYEMYED